MKINVKFLFNLYLVTHNSVTAKKNQHNIQKYLGKVYGSQGIAGKICFMMPEYKTQR